MSCPFRICSSACLWRPTTSGVLIDWPRLRIAPGAKPVRKVYYNIPVTALGVAVALIIGGIEVTSIFVDKLDITAGPVALVGSLDLNVVGFYIVGLFILTWLVALAVWKFGRIEDKWEAGLIGVRPALEASFEGELDLSLDDDLRVG